MAQNKILPWAQTGTANVLSDSDYASDVASGGLYGDGVKTGQASSKQANKTWRQATAPGSGLGQFLVDNLSVDVTDADTPSTFSTRIANAVLKLAQISPFNQSWATATGGYRKYAIVSDSSGNFWVSTANQNVTVPGASGANWQSLFNGYATQAWSSSQFVGRGASVYDFTPLQLGVNKASGQVWTSYTDDSGSVKYAFSQPAGDYATNTALSTEAAARASADTNLQSSKYDKTGGTISGDVSVTGGMTVSGSAGITANYDPGSPASGSFINYPGFSSIAEGRGGEFHFQVQEWVGNSFLGLITLRDGGGNLRFLRIPAGLRINDSQFGDVAYTSDLGNYVTTATYNNDFATSDSRVINLAYGHKIQAFTVTVDGNGSNSHRITYPQAFSGASTAVFNCNDTGQSRSVSLANGTQPDSTGFNISVSVHGNSTGPSNAGLTLTVIAIGPK